MLDELRRLELASQALDPDAPARGRLRDAVEASVGRFLESLSTRKAFRDGTGEGLLHTGIGRDARPIEELLAVIEREVIDPGASPASGGHLAFIPGGGIYHAALADYLAAVTNKYPGIFFSGPGAVRMENQVLRWVADLVGYPSEAGGNLASGGSIANLTAITTARDAHGLRSADIPSAVVYVTAQGHHSLDKALRIAGLAEAPIRRIPMDERFRMRPEALVEAIRADRAAGQRPWLIVANAGTTDTGAIDPLDTIADVAEDHGCWLHVDAAYGGFFLLTDYGRRVLAGIERSDSVVLDPHKGLFLPWGSGVVLVRDIRQLATAHGATGHYMQDALAAPGEISPADVSPELTKPFRALRMWLPLMLVGTEPFRAALEEKLLLSRYFHREIARLGFEAGPEPELSVSTFRWAPPDLSIEETNRINQGIVDRVRQDGRVLLTSTTIDGRYTIRMAALSFRTHRREVDLALEALAGAREGR